MFELKGFDPKHMEDVVREYHSTIDLRRVLEEDKGRGVIGFVEGPPTMNGEPHLGHLRGRVIKDVWYRFNTMKGFRVVFRAGWDTQGLPVELQAEKELGLTGSKLENLKSIGMERLVEECKRLVHRYNERWVEADRLLGMSMDYEHAYWTYRDGYIEREWRYLKRAWEQGILAEGYRVVAYCPSCQTSLSHAEVAQGYEMVEDPSLYYKVRLVDGGDGDDGAGCAYIVVWTTMPFTVVTDEMVGVNPDAEYVYVRVDYGDGEVWLVGKDRLEPLMDELGIGSYSILKTVKGHELEGRRYEHPLLDLIPGLREVADKVHMVVAEGFVDTNTGSGIVHLSPANGEEDFEVASRRSLPVFNPLDDRAVFTQDAGIFAGLFVRDADAKVVELLRERGSLLKVGRIRHEYPTCWRSHHRLVWMARREYFYLIDRIADKALAAAEQVEYFYPEPRNRFLAIIGERKPWCISRERVWGTPLPIWVCSNPSCRAKVALFSRDEIIRNAVELPDGEGFELHRPWIDRVVVRCSRCNSKAYREPFVLDTWHNSGAAPYASMSDEEHEHLVPVPFLTEGIDQTRGWAYTLLMENVIMKDRDEAPFRAFLFQGHIVDEHGNKMSKSLGNVIYALDLLKNNPVDMVRFYFMWKASPIDALSFSMDEMRRRVYQVLSTLYNLHIYFIQNAGYDGYDHNRHTLEWAVDNLLLKVSEVWLLSRLQALIERVTNGYERCRFHDAARAMESFIIDDLSQTYVPFTRYELWDDSMEGLNRRLAIYSVLAHVLLTIDILLHPICPFITEYLYLACFRRKPSLLLEEWVRPSKEMVNREVERSFSILNSVISTANSARMKASLKRRWPLADAYVCLSSRDTAALTPLLDIMRVQMNVEDVRLVALDARDPLERALRMLEVGLPVRVDMSLRLKGIAGKARGDLPRVMERFSSMDKVELLRELCRSGRFSLVYGDKAIEVSRDDVDVTVEPMEGYVLKMDEGADGMVMVILSTVRDRRLMAKGMVRDIARRLQTLRKEKGYNPTDVVDVAYISGLDDESMEMVNDFRDELAYLVRAKRVEITNEHHGDGIEWREMEMDGRVIRLSI
ncbi:MAG: isoleucine--tRNA ligase [Candidatus Nitrosocaldus sp.]|nr:isoleucine--tRNA ligase [Candidatus Nitrosocaldus sp.]MDW8276084.1 isoleucine--tRNA ligase [Candidatus Nitrosocaldus sp.]